MSHTVTIPICENLAYEVVIEPEVSVIGIDTYPDFRIDSCFAIVDGQRSECVGWNCGFEEFLIEQVNLILEKEEKE